MNRRALPLLLVLGLSLSACGVVRGANDARDAVGDVREVAENLEEGTTGDKELDELIARAEAAQDATFRAEYRITDQSSGSESTMILVQDPPRGRWETAGDDSSMVFIDDGEDAITCFPFGESGELQCTREAGAGGHGNVSAAAVAFNPVAMIAALKAFMPLIDDFDVEHYDDRKAGEAVDCVRLSSKQDDQLSEYCVTGDGIWAWSSDGGQEVELVEYSSTVSDADFQPPAEVVAPGDLYGTPSEEPSP